MLVIDRENDRVLLSRQSRFVPRMWSCLAGFIEVSALANFRTNTSVLWNMAVTVKLVTLSNISILVL